MRTKFTALILAGAMLLVLASCGSLEGDAKKLAKMHYDLDQIGNNVGSSSNMYTQKANEVFKFESQTWEKYSKNPEAKKRFQQLFEAELERLKK